MTPSHTVSDDLIRVALSLFEGLAGSLTPKAIHMLKERDWDGLTSLKVVPSDYSDAESYFADAQIAAFFKKCDGLPTSHNQLAAALKNFEKAEESCYRANERLSKFAYHSWSDDDKHVADMLLTARKWIRRTLGSPPSAEHLAKRAKFGPGSTFGDRAPLTTVPDKMSSRPTFTAAFDCLAPLWGQTLWARNCFSPSEGYAVRLGEYVRGNRFTTVPKDSTKFRGIAVEPSVNLFYQLALGSVLKDKLAYAGLDLRHNKELHMRVARESSITGRHSTIDLSNASDSLCKILVKILLPTGWYELFEAMRCPVTKVNGNWRYLEKYSSMGNGYTFELETLIFSSLCYATAQMRGHDFEIGRDMWVFGDDIIVPSEMAQDVIAVLRYVGFETNVDKTFVEGSFRESCGGDYFAGIDVRPFYLRNLPNEPQHYIALANGIRRVCRSSGHTYDRFSRISTSWFRVLDLLPISVRGLRGPEELGDIVIHDDQRFWKTKTRNCIRYLYCYKPARFFRIQQAHFRPEIVLASSIYSPTLWGWGGHERGYEGVSPRDNVLGFKIGWVPFS